MAITLGSTISLRAAAGHTATIAAATGVVILIDSIDRSNSAMAQSSESGATGVIMDARLEGIYGDAMLSRSR